MAKDRVSMRFNGTGAALRLGLGFIPDWVILTNLEDGGGLAPRLEWKRISSSADQQEGVLVDSSSVRTELTAGNGVTIFRGGQRFGDTQSTYLHADPVPDKRAANANADAIST